jgi:hypothetical protein
MNTEHNASLPSWLPQEGAEHNTCTENCLLILAHAGPIIAAIASVGPEPEVDGRHVDAS